jgi:hypothetical protein
MGNDDFINSAIKEALSNLSETVQGIRIDLIELSRAINDGSREDYEKYLSQAQSKLFSLSYIASFIFINEKNKELEFKVENPN